MNVFFFSVHIHAQPEPDFGHVTRFFYKVMTLPDTETKIYKRLTKIEIIEYRGSPTYAVFTTVDPTNAIFRLCKVQRANLTCHVTRNTRNSLRLC